MKRLALCTLLTVATLTLAGCANENLYVQSKYVTYEDLASFHVESPDPRKDCPDTGHQLLVRWSLPTCAMAANELILRLRMRYGNHEQQTLVTPIAERRGLFVYELLNDEYFCKEGIESYIAEIIADDEVIEEWRHQIWTDLIDFDS